MRLCLLAAGLLGPAGHAQPRSVHLIYLRGAGADRCPAQPELQQGVIARLGRDPFWGRGARPVWITISRSGAELVATIAAQADDGGPAQVRAVTSRRAECDDLAAAVELALAIAIDPAAALGRPRPPVPAQPDEPPVESREEPPPPPPSPAATISSAAHSPPPAAVERRWFAAAGLLLSAGAGPDPAAGLALGFGARRGPWSLAIEARLDYPTEVPYHGGALAAAPFLATVVPCFHLRWAAACALAAAGGFRGAARDLPNPHVQVTAYFAAGARLGAEWPAGGRFGLAAHLDLLAPLTPTHLWVDQTDVWHTPPVSGTVGVSAVEHFQ